MGTGKAVGDLAGQRWGHLSGSECLVRVLAMYGCNRLLVGLYHCRDPGKAQGLVHVGN